MKALLLAVPVLLAASEAAAQARTERPEWETAIGILLHDRSPFADRHEDGIDLNAELIFPRPAWEAWTYLLAPRPHVGVNANLAGDTSYLYGGLTWEIEPFGRFLAAGSVGLVVHDGPLHKTQEQCVQNDDCGFGSRASVRLAGEIGVRLDERNAVTVLIDHISHGSYFAEENEGVDNIGIRWLHAY